MNLKALGIFLSTKKQRIGVLFQYELAPDTVMTRFVADEAFMRMQEQPTLSAGYLAQAPAEQEALWRDVKATVFNGRFSNKNGWLLPAFFQNLLPEGVFRDHVAAQRKCDPKDNFEMLAACGKDLPGSVYALPVELSREDLSRYVTQDNDALEMSVTAEPLEEGVSLSGVQPKVGAIKDGERYVGRTKDRDTHIIAKLPVVGQPLLPEVEELSLRLAREAGVNVCEARLEPLELLTVEHGYDLGDAGAQTKFLAVTRFDRGPKGRIHCEDFAQAQGVMPEEKYGVFHQAGSTSYLEIAAVMMSFPASLGEPAVHELLRRLVVNEMLGNPDMHLKNVGLTYLDGRTPTLSPAYDVVAYAAYNRNAGHALTIVPAHLQPASREQKDGAAPRKQMLSPGLVRAFCSALDIPEKPAATAIKDAVQKAFNRWPGLIQSSDITATQKARLLEQVSSHPMIESLKRRKKPGR